MAGRWARRDRRQRGSPPAPAGRCWHRVVVPGDRGAGDCPEPTTARSHRSTSARPACSGSRPRPAHHAVQRRRQVAQLCWVETVYRDNHQIARSSRAACPDVGRRTGSAAIDDLPRPSARARPRPMCPRRAVESAPSRRAMVSAPAENDADGRASIPASDNRVHPSRRETDTARPNSTSRQPSPGTVTSIPKCHDRGYAPIHSTGAMFVGRTFSYRMVSANADSRRIDGPTYGYPTRR